MKYFKNCTISLVLSLITFFIRLSLIINEDDTVIVYGIKKYRKFNTISTVLLILFISLMVFFGIKDLIKLISAKKEAMQKEKELELEKLKEIENKKDLNSYLSTSKTLQETVIRQHLKEAFSKTWNELSEELSPLYAQSLKMDDLQDRLKSLITKNDASILDDTEDILNDAEQNLLENIRKVMNYMDVCDPTTFEGREKVRINAKSCFEQNKQIIETATDFLFSLTEYLNNQSSTDSLKILNEYKQALKGAASAYVSPEQMTPDLKF